jgi:leucyl aminopeptidase (aminopeptidase T)
MYSAFCQEELPTVEEVKKILYWYVNDYCEEMAAERIRQNIDPEHCFAVELIMNSDLDKIDYLYDFGEYISENEKGVSRFLASLPQNQIDDMARTFTEGYRMGFVNGRKPLEKKKTVNIRFCLGFERVVRAAILQFENLGLRPTIYRAATHAVNKRQHIRIGYYGGIPNKQFDYDHKGDAALFMDQAYVHRKLRAAQNFYEKHKDQAQVHGGPACMEIFGEVPFVPEVKPESLKLSGEQQKLSVSCDNEMSQITNRYIPGEERSFTIIAYPVPEIGENFPELFAETVKINTLDYHLYEKIQQTIIEALDLGEQVHIKGCGNNETDLYVQLHELKDRSRETNFENCVADVNIPVGEVFTSPKLEGTNGVLHVSQVYLNELQYQNLKITFKDGRIASYSCSNFDQEEENHRYIWENVLYHHDTLPMGEFAIGTNTTAYAMAQKYGIQEKLPILIAEKMGPHFAVGDTCYSWAEDVEVYNPDGREIIARDNEVSILRKEDPGQAYMGCHTDITIPYEELDYIRAICPDGREISIIEKGRFVLPGTEMLNLPLGEN